MTTLDGIATCSRKYSHNGNLLPHCFTHSRAIKKSLCCESRMKGHRINLGMITPLTVYFGTYNYYKTLPRRTRDLNARCTIKLRARQLPSMALETTFGAGFLRELRLMSDGRCATCVKSRSGTASKLFPAAVHHHNHEGIENRWKTTNVPGTSDNPGTDTHACTRV